MVVLLLGSIGLFVLASALRWSGSATTLSRRNSEYFKGSTVAAAAAEKVSAKMVRDFHFSGPAYVDSQLPPLFAALRARGGCLAIICSDHGTTYGEDGFTGHRLAHPTVWTVPYAELVIEP